MQQRGENLKKNSFINPGPNDVSYLYVLCSFLDSCSLDKPQNISKYCSYKAKTSARQIRRKLVGSITHVDGRSKQLLMYDAEKPLYVVSLSWKHRLLRI